MFQLICSSARLLDIGAHYHDAWLYLDRANSHVVLMKERALQQQGLSSTLWREDIEYSIQRLDVSFVFNFYMQWSLIMHTVIFFDSWVGVGMCLNIS